MIFVSGMILTAAEPEKSQKSRGRSGPGHNTETGGTSQRHQGKGGQPCFYLLLNLLSFFCFAQIGPWTQVYFEFKRTMFEKLFGVKAPFSILIKLYFSTCIIGHIRRKVHI